MGLVVPVTDVQQQLLTHLNGLDTVGIINESITDFTGPWKYGVH